MKKTVLPLIIVLGFIFFTGTGYFLGSNKGLGLLKNNAATSSDIMLITNPVNNFSGKVDKIEGNSVIISQQVTQIAPPPQTLPSGQPQAMPTPIIKILSYAVKITANTQINQPAVSVPYLFTNAALPTPPKGTIKSLVPGLYVSVSTNTDLRTLTKKEFEASSIQLPQIMNTITGKIVNIKENLLTLKGIPPQSPTQQANSASAPPQQKEVEYTVAISSNTEISRYAPGLPGIEGEPAKPPGPEKLSLKDLKQDLQVTIYSDSDVTVARKIKALRIEPFFPMPTPVATTNPTTIAVPPLSIPTNVPTIVQTLPTEIPATPKPKVTTNPQPTEF